MKSLEAIREAAHQWAGTVVPTLLGAHVVAPEHRDDPEEYVRIICEDMIPTAAKLKLAEFVDVFCERGAFTMEQSRASCAPLSNTISACGRMCASSRPQKLAPLLEFRPASLDHMDFVSDEDIAVLAKLDTVATLLPAANYFLGLESISAGAQAHRLPASPSRWPPTTTPAPRQPVHAVRAFGRLHAHEDVARRGDRRGHLQRCLRAAAARQEGKPRARQRRRHRHLRRARITANWPIGLE